MGSWAWLVAIWFIFGDRIIACQLYDPDRFLHHSSQVWWINKFKIMPARAHASSFLHYQSLFRAFFLLSFKLEQADGGFFSVWFDDIILQFHFDRKDLNGKKKKKHGGFNKRELVTLVRVLSLKWEIRRAQRILRDRNLPWRAQSDIRTAIVNTRHSLTRG